MPVIVYRNFVLDKMDGNVNLSLFKPGIVQLGYSTNGIADTRYQRGKWQNFGCEVNIQGECTIQSGVKFSLAENAELVIGNHFSSNVNTQIICTKKIFFGDDVLLSWDCLIMDSDFHKIINCTNALLVEDCITIENHVWIGCRSTILKGATIKPHSVVAANSTITKKYKEGNLLLGGINKILKCNIDWEN